MDDIQREMERYLAHFARTGKRPTIVFSRHSHSGPVWTPAVDMFETREALVIVLEIAGVDASQTDIQAEPGRLTIRGVRRQRPAPAQPANAPTDQPRTYHALEIAYGPFERTLPLPPGVDTTAARASYRDGILEITLPKRLPQQVRISVDSASEADR